MSSGSINTSTEVNMTVLSSTDLTAILYGHYYNNKTLVPSLTLNTSLPLSIEHDLEEYGLQFDQLDGSLQRAILWDAGYININTNRFIQIYTWHGKAMSEIQVSRSMIQSTGCGVQACSHPNDGSSWRSTQCSDELLEPVLQCAIDLASINNIHIEKDVGQTRSLWALRNIEDPIQSSTGLAISTLNIALHEWKRNNDSTVFRIFSIHTIPFTQEPIEGQCPTQSIDAQGNTLPVMIIPCAAFDSSRNVRPDGWKEPKQSSLLTAWLASKRSTLVPHSTPLVEDHLPSSGPNSNEVSKESKESNIMVYIIPIFIGTIVLIAIGMGFVVTRRRRASSNSTTTPPSKYTRDTYDPSEDGGYLEGSIHLSPHRNEVPDDLSFCPEKKDSQ